MKILHGHVIGMEAERTETSRRFDRRHRRIESLFPVIGDLPGYIDIGNAVSIGHAERFILQILAHPPETPAGHTVEPGIHAGYTPRFDSGMVDFHRVVFQVERHVGTGKIEFGEIIPDHFTFIAA